MTEAIADATDRRAPLYVIALDVRKAFDIVDHSSLLRKLYHQTDSPTWRYIHQSLKTSARVQLGGSYGRPFDVNQGVGQGKIMSTHNYKLYVNNLLLQLTNIQSGAKIGETFIGAPTCADDIILMAADLVVLLWNYRRKSALSQIMLMGSDITSTQTSRSVSFMVSITHHQLS